MAKPSDKSEDFEKALEGMFGFDRRTTIKADRCIPKPYGCGGPATEFRNEISRKEYSISGLCQECQDSIFGRD